MFRLALLALLVVASPTLGRHAWAQDIVGLEDCAQAKGPDKKFGCLQANVEFLQGLIKKNDVAAQARLREEMAKLTAATTRLDELREEVARLRAAIEQLEKRTPKPPSPQSR